MDGVVQNLKRLFTGRECTKFIGMVSCLSHPRQAPRSVAHVLEQGHGLASGIRFQKDEFSISKNMCSLVNKLLWTRACSVSVEAKCILNEDSRVRFCPPGMYRGRAGYSFHTGIKALKLGYGSAREFSGGNLNSSLIESTEDKGADYGPPGKKEADHKVTEAGEEKLVTRKGSVATKFVEDDDEVPQVSTGSSERHHESRDSTSTKGEVVNANHAAQAMALLRAALDEADEEDGPVDQEFQRSLRVGIVGAPNAGKSLLTNRLVGTRVSAVSRKTNTTHREHLGVFTKGDTQLLYYDTPGLHLDIEGSPLRVEARHRVRNAWQIADFCEVLVVLIDAERQIRKPDRRVERLVEKLGSEQMVSQKKVLCLNKVDIIVQKRLLLPLAKSVEHLTGYDRIFMISGLTGSGVNDVKDYLLSQAVRRTWEEDPECADHRDIALEIVREQVFEHMHEELPHTTKQKLVSWKVLKDGSVRIQQLLLVAKKEHQKMLVGKNGAVIGDIGIKARQELQKILGVTVHLILDVDLMTSNDQMVIS